MAKASQVVDALCGVKPQGPCLLLGLFELELGPGKKSNWGQWILKGNIRLHFSCSDPNRPPTATRGESAGTCWSMFCSTSSCSLTPPRPSRATRAASRGNASTGPASASEDGWESCASTARAGSSRWPKSFTVEVVDWEGICPRNGFPFNGDSGIHTCVNSTVWETYCVFNKGVTGLKMVKKKKNSELCSVDFENV